MIWLDVDHVNRHVNIAFDRLFWDPPSPVGDPGKMAMRPTMPGTMAC